MSLIRISPNRYGHLTLRFVSIDLTQRIRRQTFLNGGPTRDDAYIQLDTDIEALKESLPRRARRDLDNGWTVVVRMDGWEAAHYFGYDTHTIFERKPT